MDSESQETRIALAKIAFESYMDCRVYTPRVTREVYELATIILDTFDIQRHDFIALGRSPVLVMAALKVLTNNQINLANLPLSLRHQHQTTCEGTDITPDNITRFQYYLQLFAPMLQAESDKPIVLIDFVNTAKSLLFAKLFIEHLTGKTVFCAAFGHKGSQKFVEMLFKKIPYIFITDGIVEGWEICVDKTGYPITGMFNASTMLNQLSSCMKRHSLYPSYELFSDQKPAAKPEISAKWMQYVTYFKQQARHLKAEDKPGVFSISSTNLASVTSHSGN